MNFSLSNKALSTVTIASLLNPSTYGQVVTFTVAVTGGLDTPTGTVTFHDDGNPIDACGTSGVVNLDGSAQATCALSTLSASNHLITALYSGDATYNAGTSNIVAQAVGQKPLTVTADAKHKMYGTADPALTYQVTSGALVTGDVFTGTLKRVAGENVGSYAIQQGTLTAGSNYDLTYVGANFTITQATVTITLTSFPNPSVLGQLITFTAITDRPGALRLQLPTACPLTGNMTFKEGATLIGTGGFDANCQALFLTSGLPLGDHAITAEYAGDANFASSTSSVLTQTVSIFAPTYYTLTLSLIGSGLITPTVGAHTYLSGTVVPLSASPDVGWKFSGWSGDVDCADGSVTLNANKLCTAIFARYQVYLPLILK